ncbi:MAG: DNA recombination/repair protein RecA, partial [Solirubrobacteraceae bacterium]
GISTSGCLIDLGIEHDVVQKSGSFFSFDGERLAQGRSNAKAFLNENPEIAGRIEQLIYEKLGMRPAAEVPLTPIAEPEPAIA